MQVSNKKWVYSTDSVVHLNNCWFKFIFIWTIYILNETFKLSVLKTCHLNDFVWLFLTKTHVLVENQCPISRAGDGSVVHGAVNGILPHTAVFKDGIIEHR